MNQSIIHKHSSVSNISAVKPKPEEKITAKLQFFYKKNSIKTLYTQTVMGSLYSYNTVIKQLFNSVFVINLHLNSVTNWQTLKNVLYV